MLSGRLRGVIAQILEDLATEAGGEGCLHCEQTSLDRAGFVTQPNWIQSRDRLRPPRPWRVQLNTISGRGVIFAGSDAADQAPTRWHAGLGAGSVLP